ncbi:MAG: C-terminal helicase domain-containing protein, partial [Bacteroidota bacterium]
KVRADRVQKAMARANISSLLLHGDVEQAKRMETLSAFRKNKERLLIATDVSARGIDISDVTHVINYDLPEQADQYVHRIGRTGRGKKRGVAYSFCAPNERPLLDSIQQYTGYEISVIDLDRSAYRETLRQAKEDKFGLEELMRETENVIRRNKKRKK